MAETTAQNERTRLLGRELRRIRKERGLTITAAAERVLRSAASLSRIENGRVRVAMRDLKFLLNEYEVADGPERTRLFTLCAESNRKGWWQKYSDVVASADLISFEAGAERISNLETILIPGLLQTRDYFEAMLLATPFALTERVIKRSLDARAQRQRILDRADPPFFHAVLHEAALRSIVGSTQTSRDQLAHLLTLSHRPHIRLQVLPFSTGAYNGFSSPLTIFELPGFRDSPVVFLDDPVRGSTCVENEEQAARYSLILNHLSAAALSEEETRSLIGSIREGL
jgi:transcriptional regulator with XRE-family HTH domain